MTQMVNMSTIEGAEVHEIYHSYLKEIVDAFSQHNETQAHRDTIAHALRLIYQGGRVYSRTDPIVWAAKSS